MANYWYSTTCNMCKFLMLWYLNKESCVLAFLVSQVTKTYSSLQSPRYCISELTWNGQICSVPHLVIPSDQESCEKALSTAASYWRLASYSKLHELNLGTHERSSLRVALRPCDEAPPTSILVGYDTSLPLPAKEKAFSCSNGLSQNCCDRRSRGRHLAVNDPPWASVETDGRNDTAWTVAPPAVCCESLMANLDQSLCADSLPGASFLMWEENDRHGSRTPLTPSSLLSLSPSHWPCSP